MNDPESLFFPETAARRPLLIAGPCSAETEEQLLTTARALAAAGASLYYLSGNTEFYWSTYQLSLIHI